MADRIDTTTEELTTALATFEQGKAALLRSDGSMKYSEPEHHARLKALTETLHGVARRVDDAADAELAAVRRLEEAAHDDPTIHLTPAELQLSNARAQFVREDAMQHLTLAQLATRLRGIVAAGGDKPDRVQAFLWSRYAGQRLASEVETARAGGGALPAHLREQVEAIEPLVAQLAAVVVPQSGISKAEAQRRIKRAREVQGEIRRRVAEADGTFAELRRAMRGSGRYAI